MANMSANGQNLSSLQTANVIDVFWICHHMQSDSHPAVLNRFGRWCSEWIVISLLFFYPYFRIEKEERKKGSHRKMAWLYLQCTWGVVTTTAAPSAPTTVQRYLTSPLLFFEKNTQTNYSTTLTSWWPSRFHGDFGTMCMQTSILTFRWRVGGEGRRNEKGGKERQRDGGGKSSWVIRCTQNSRIG